MKYAAASRGAGRFRTRRPSLATLTALLLSGFAFLILAGPAQAASPFDHQIIDDRGPYNPGCINAGDVNGDGFPDLLAASSGNGPIVWYEYPSWDKHEIAARGRWSTDIEVADIDGDGDGDLIASDWYLNNRIEWYENPGPQQSPETSSWKLHPIGSPRAHDIEVGDLDDDGDLDIVTRTQFAAGATIEIWTQGTPTSWTHTSFSCPRGEGLRLSDVDDDGDPDIVIATRWYETPSFTEHVYSTTWTYQNNKVETADVNGDGRLDIIVAPSEYSGDYYRTSWFEAPENPEDAGWTEHVIASSVEAVVHSLGAADMDGDGDMDVVSAEMHQSVDPDEIRVYYNNNGSGTSWTKQVAGTGGSHNMVVVDVGNDGRYDLFGSNWSSFATYAIMDLWMNTGATVAVELSRFDVLASSGDVTVNWETAVEDGVAGFHVLRSSTSGVEDAVRVTESLIPGGTRTYTYQDRELESGHYWYWLEEVTRSGEVNRHGPRDVVVSLEGTPLFLGQNRPNPFTRSTEIMFSVAAGSPVTLGIYGASGRLVRSLLRNEIVASGMQRISWDGTAEDGTRAAAGVYFYRLRIGDGRALTRKLHLIR